MKQGYYIKNGIEFPIYQPNHYNILHNNDFLSDFLVYGRLSGSIGCSLIGFKSRDITEVVLPSGYVRVECGMNKIKKLIVTEDTQEILCHNNQIEELEITSKEFVYLRATNNPIKKLILPEIVKRNKYYEVIVRLDMDTPINLMNHPNISFNLY